MSQQLPDKLDEVNVYDLLKLILEVFQCIEDKAGQTPYIDVLAENMLIIDMESKRFRVTIDDCSRYQ